MPLDSDSPLMGFEKRLFIRILASVVINIVSVVGLAWLLAKSRYFALFALIGSGRNLLGSVWLFLGVALSWFPPSGDVEFLKQQFLGQATLITVYAIMYYFRNAFSDNGKCYLLGRFNKLYVLFWILKWYSAAELIFRGTHWGYYLETCLQLLSVLTIAMTVFLDVCLLLGRTDLSRLFAMML